MAKGGSLIQEQDGKKLRQYCHAKLTESKDLRYSSSTQLPPIGFVEQSIIVVCSFTYYKAGCSCRIQSLIFKWNDNTQLTSKRRWACPPLEQCPRHWPNIKNHLVSTLGGGGQRIHEFIPKGICRVENNGQDCFIFQIKRCVVNGFRQNYNIEYNNSQRETLL